MTSDELRAELERLQAENAQLKASGARKIHFKVSQKGAVSVYGMGRFPITLYKEQWLTLLDLSQQLKDFIKAFDAELKTKDKTQ